MFQFSLKLFSRSMTVQFIFFYFCCNVISLADGVHPDVFLNAEQRIEKHGYPVEIHKVCTEDGYILNMYRIPHGLEKSENEPKNKSVVLFVHAPGGLPHNFIALGKKVAPAYYFADRGFDVWLFCARGVDCQNPKKHENFHWNKDPNYWDFSFHEIALYDLSASIDFVLNKTGQKKIFHIGFSGGGSQYYALMSEKPEYNDKIKINVNYGSGVISKEMDHPFLRVLCRFSDMLKNIYAAIGMYELLPPFITDMLGDTLRRLCADPKWFRSCKVGLWSIGSHVSKLIEDDMVEVAYINIPQRLSIKLVTHFMDNVIRGDFRKYDYGPRKNIEIYGQNVAPAYNLTACTAPNAFFYGATDSINTQEDVWALQQVLPNTILDYEVGPNFVHLDFIFAKNASHMVYEPTVKLFKEYDAGIVSSKVIR